MAWEWSHTAEAYAAAEANLAKKSIKFLAECYAEWACKAIADHDKQIEDALLMLDSSIEYESTDPYFDGRYEGAVTQAKKIAKEQGKDSLAQQVWEYAEEGRTCENGGFDAWMCPTGCHTVSFG